MKHTIFLLVIVTMIVSCRAIKPPQPNIKEEPIVFEEPPVSNITIPVSVDLTNTIAEVDQKINEVFPIQTPGFPNEFEQSCEIRYKYQVLKAAPIQFSLGPSTDFPINFAAEIKAGAGGTFCPLCVNLFGRRCVAPKIGLSCGVNGESPRRIFFSLRSAVDVNPDYTLAGRTQLKDFYFIDPCRVTFLNIDISGLIQSQARGRIPIGKIDERINAVSLREPANKLWEFLSKKISAGDGLFLKIHPEKLMKSSFSGQEKLLNFELGVQAKPELTTNADDPVAAPLPNLEPTVGSGLNVFTDLKIDYPFISKKLNEALDGEVIKVGSKKIRIRNVTVWGTKNRELIARVDFGGSKRGCVYLLGKPSYDGTSREIKFSNLQYDIQTNDVLLNVAAWLLEPIVINAIRDKARFPVGQFIDDNTTKLNAVLNKEYEGGIITEGKINSVNIVDNNFQSLPQFLFIRTHTQGELKVKIKM